MTNKLVHLNRNGEARMVDVSGKDVTTRVAIATSVITMTKTAFDAVNQSTLEKGDALSVARVAGIQAAKKTSDLIPLCHPLALTGVDVTILPDERACAFAIRVVVRTNGQTGVEMEALVAASAAALTVYDMVKSRDRSMTIGPTQLEEKSGGKSGHYRRDDAG